MLFRSYLIITVILLLVAIIKIIIMKKEIKNITQNLPIIIKSDTNSLITIGTNDNDLKNLAKTLNNSLKELRRLELEYNQGNQELKRSITDISHDLRTPLTAIRGYLDLIDYKNLTSKQVEYLKIINNKTDTLIYLTEQLFDFSKTLEIHDDINKRETCINTILEEVICSYYDLFKENNIEPIVDITTQKIMKTLDENMLKRIFENVISNAIKYSDNTVNISLNKEGIICVSNKAKDLDNVTVNKIFDRYYTVKNAKKSNGIGLSIAKQLVELNGGKIKADYTDDNLTITIKI